MGNIAEELLSLLEAEKSNSYVYITSTPNSFSVQTEGEYLFPFGKNLSSIPKNSVYYIIDESDFITFRSVSNEEVLFTVHIPYCYFGETQATKDNIVELFEKFCMMPQGGKGDVSDSWIGTEEEYESEEHKEDNLYFIYKEDNE